MPKSENINERASIDDGVGFSDVVTIDDIRQLLIAKTGTDDNIDEVFGTLTIEEKKMPWMI